MALALLGVVSQSGVIWQGPLSQGQERGLGEGDTMADVTDVVGDLEADLETEIMGPPREREIVGPPARRWVAI